MGDVDEHQPGVVVRQSTATPEEVKNGNLTFHGSANRSYHLIILETFHGSANRSYHLIILETNLGNQLL